MTAPPPPGSPRTRPKARREEWAGPLMALPAIAGLVLFVALPFAMAIGLSLFNVRLDSFRPPEFFALEQYRRILVSSEFSGDFYRALGNNVLFAAVIVPVQVTAALGLALLLNRPLRGMPVFRTFFFMPVVFPMALIATVWRLIFDPGPDGMLNSVLGLATFGLFSPHDWLGEASTAMPSIMLLSLWQGVGLQMVIILAGLQGIPGQLYEAAEVDGAGRWQRFRAVTLPGLRNTLVFVALVTTILSFRLFDQVYILTRGGPDGATSTVMHLAVTTAFAESNVGRAAAMTVVLFVVVLCLTLLQRRLVTQEREIS
ncbi:sugar ABC transporter permease [Nocardiopsis sp. N85]|uniref:carbohydrate ABC transporter permease n=1 Tax=Nocardiopsis sp. N85 TaxID=3029400 RepID=UPI00237FBDB5|nr:sugar ABC transporter permease [Nocardiopsis sp. N85]MDE3721950.1 sugar ABC transporter permease [Nocardiopsis sp. N85]